MLELVVEKTGYPKDMLDLDLDLEADLGIDTVKQAEMFASIREIYNIPRDPNLKLRDFPTLAHVIQFVYDRRPDLAAATSATRCWPGTRAPVAELRGRRPAKGPGDRRREDRLSQGNAGPRTRSRSRPGHRHGQTGGDVRLRARRIQHPARHESEVARFPDAGARHPVRARPPKAVSTRRRNRLLRQRSGTACPSRAFDAANRIPRRVRCR